MSLFTALERNMVYKRILSIGESDSRITGGALVGSYATGSKDRWSDIDITFGVKSDLEPILILEEWTALLKTDFDILDYFDVKSASAIYRVFLFSNGLELDLSVVPEKDYGPKAPSFKLLFGKANEQTNFPPPPVHTLIGWGWHHVLHANSAIHRSRLWQAEFWISSLRNHLLSMKCIRFSLPAAQARGVDQLPPKELSALDSTFIHTLEKPELQKALTTIAKMYIHEVRQTDEELAVALEGLFQKILIKLYS